MLEAATIGSTPDFDMERAKTELHQQDLAIRMFYAPGKQSFYLENIEIHNLYDLKVALDRIPPDDAIRLADWILYLGDEDLARRIYRNPEKMRDFVLERYQALNFFFRNEDPNNRIGR